MGKVIESEGQFFKEIKNIYQLIAFLDSPVQIWEAARGRMYQWDKIEIQKATLGYLQSMVKDKLFYYLAEDK